MKIIERDYLQKLINVVETDKVGLEQINDKICK